MTFYYPTVLSADIPFKQIMEWELWTARWKATILVSGKGKLTCFFSFIMVKGSRANKIILDGRLCADQWHAVISCAREVHDITVTWKWHHFPVTWLESALSHLQGRLPAFLEAGRKRAEAPLWGPRHSVLSKDGILAALPCLVPASGEAGSFPEARADTVKPPEPYWAQPACVCHQGRLGRVSLASNDFMSLVQMHAWCNCGQHPLLQSEKL